MKEEILKHVAAFNAAKGRKTDEASIIATIRDAHKIWKDEGSDRRWWTDHFMVVDINGLKIGFMGAETTGDDSPYDKGWEFDPSSICLVEPYDVTITNYREKK